MKQVLKHLHMMDWIFNYKREYLNGDIFAGITVGIMLIPQGMAYALIAGLPPVYGLYASIVPQIIYAISGTSRQLSIGPSAMDSLLVAAGISVLASEGTDAYIGFAILLAFFTGLLQLLLGIFRMGFITNLLSKPIISGFTSAAAIIIGLNQLKYLFGFEIEKSGKIHEILWSTVQRLDEIHIITFIIGIGGIIIIKGAKKINKNIPSSLIAVILGILLTYIFQLSEFGVSIVQTIPEGLPLLKIPDFDLDKISRLIPLALTISIVAFIESYSVAKAIESKCKGYKVIANRELIGLGAANLIGALFQSYPVAGGFSRSAVNHQSGANTPLSSIISAGLIALTLLFLTPIFYYLPKAILASVIMVAVSGLMDLAYAKKLWRENKIEFALLIATFLITLNFSMVSGILTGVVLSILMLLYHAAYPHIALLGRIHGQSEFRNIKRFKDLEVWDDRLILRVDAPLTFINIQYVKEYIEQKLEDDPLVRSVLLDASAVSKIDATASQGLRDLLETFNEKGIRLLVAELVGPVRDSLYDTGLLDEIGEKNIFLTVNNALEYSDKERESQYRDRAIQHGEIKA